MFGCVTAKRQQAHLGNPDLTANLPVVVAKFGSLEAILKHSTTQGLAAFA